MTIVSILRLTLANHRIQITIFLIKKAFFSFVIYWKHNKHKVCCFAHICHLNPLQTSFPSWKFLIYHDIPLAAPTVLSTSRHLLHSNTSIYYLILDHILLSNYYVSCYHNAPDTYNCHEGKLLFKVWRCLNIRGGNRMKLMKLNFII